MAYGDGKKQMMPNMKAYNRGYKPSEGSAGGEAFGEYSNKKNPRPVPEKGSEIKAASAYGMNSDKSKVMQMKNQQMKKEDLRGTGC